MKYFSTRRDELIFLFNLRGNDREIAHAIHAIRVSTQFNVDSRPELVHVMFEVGFHFLYLQSLTLELTLVFVLLLVELGFGNSERFFDAIFIVLKDTHWGFKSTHIPF